MNARPIKLSEKDIRILKVLEQNSRLSYREISKLTDIGATTIHKKVQKWVKKGLIKRFTIDINWELLGRSNIAYMSLLVDFPNEIGAIDAYLRILGKIFEIPQVESVASVTGRTDIIVRVRVRNSDELNSILNKLWVIEHISRTETYVGLYDGKIGKAFKNESIKAKFEEKLPFKQTHLKILQALQGNAKASLREIADKIGVSHALVHSYIKELAGKKVIARFTVSLDNEKMNLPIKAFVLITFDFPLLKKIRRSQEEIIDEILKNPKVLYGSTVTGRIDAILLVNVEDMRKLEDFFLGVRGIKGVKRTETLVASQILHKEVVDMDKLFEIKVA